MKQLTQKLWCALIVLVGCGDGVEPTCPEGFMRISGRCMTPDASTADADAGDRPDAGPCENACMGATPLCNTTTQTCVACLAAPDCMGALTECSAAGECVACTSNEHCEDPAASVCGADGACAPCNGPDACFGIVDGAATLDTCQMGTCIECTEGSAAEDCGANSCNPATGRCTDTPRGLTVPCGACVSDGECFPMHACVPLDFDGSPHGAYCLPITEAACAERPYTVRLSGKTSASGVADQLYCGLDEGRATCEAVLALQGGSANECTPGPDSATGVYVQDSCPSGAFCVPSIGDGVSPNRCSYECGNADQCTDPADNINGSTCNLRPIGPRFCGG